MDFGVLARNAGLAASHGADAIGRAERIESWTEDHREDELIPAIYIVQRVEVFDIHVNFFARLDIRHSLGENVWPLFRKQRGNISLLFGFRVNLFCFLSLANDAAYSPLADGHDELVD